MFGPSEPELIKGKAILVSPTEDSSTFAFSAASFILCKACLSFDKSTPSFSSKFLTNRLRLHYQNYHLLVEYLQQLLILQIFHLLLLIEKHQMYHHPNQKLKLIHSYSYLDHMQVKQQWAHLKFVYI